MDTWLHMVTHMDADGHTGEWHTHGYTWLHTWIHIVKYMDEDTHGTDTHIDTHLHTYSIILKRTPSNEYIPALWRAF